MNNKKGFTLLEVLIVLGIVGILSAAVITVINPLELMKISRDAKRLSDLSGIDNAVTLYRNMFSSESLTASTTTVFLSLADTDNTLPNDCDEYSLPALPGGWNYSCVIKDDYQKINGTGWLPIDFSRLQDAIGTVPLNTLAVDPLNTGSRYYSFTSNGTDWELALSLEAAKYEETQVNDGGNDDTLYEKGTNLAVYPVTGYKLAQTYPDLLTVLTNSNIVYAAGSAGQVPYFTGANTIAGEDNLFWDSNNNRLGIGTNTPSYPLDVLGNINFTGALSGGTVPWSLLASFPSACPGGQYASAVGSSLTCGTPAGGLGGSGTAGYIAKFATATTTADSVIYESSGKIGIGTTSPAAKLEVVETISTFPRGIVSTQYSSDTGPAPFTSRKARGTALSPSAVLSGDILGAFAFVGYDGSNFISNVSSTRIIGRATENWNSTAYGSELRFFTNPNASTTSQVRMTIDNAGNVGIGTTSPQDRLVIRDATDINLGLDSGIDVSDAFILNAYNDAKSSNIPLEFRATKYVFDAIGNVGIGTADPGSYKLSVNGAVNATSPYYYNGTRVGFYGGRYSRDVNHGCFKPNPITGSCTCPSGFTADEMEWNAAVIDYHGDSEGWTGFCYLW